MAAAAVGLDRREGPAIDDTQYVIELVGPCTVNTMPEATLQAVFGLSVMKRGGSRSARSSAWA